MQSSLANPQSICSGHHRQNDIRYSRLTFVSGAGPHLCWNRDLYTSPDQMCTSRCAPLRRCSMSPTDNDLSWTIGNRMIDSRNLHTFVCRATATFNSPINSGLTDLDLFLNILSIHKAKTRLIQHGIAKYDRVLRYELRHSRILLRFFYSIVTSGSIGIWLLYLRERTSCFCVTPLRNELRWAILRHEV